MNADSTPAMLGYRWPAEWERHTATWVSWPHNQNTWPDRFEPVPGQFARLVQTLAEYESVHVLAGGAGVWMDAQTWIGDVRQVMLHDIPTNDAWCRDHGPIFLAGSPGLPPALVDWQYNAWGGKYPPFDLDNAVPGRISQQLGRRRFSPGIVLEGGAVEGNGQGVVLTTESCLLNANRNPHLHRSDVERYLADYLAADKVLWLGRGELAGDDTDGHIDQLARFVNPETVVAAWADDTLDENHGPLKENFTQLQRMTDSAGRRFEVVPLSLPAPKYVDTHRLPASYCNFYIANGIVVVPQFGDEADERAVQLLAELMPERRVVGLPALDLVWGLGAFHCLTQQEPAA